VGLAAGFERIDASQAAAGAMRLPGRLIEQLADLPIDCDAVSSLQRIALQAGVTQRQLTAQSGESAVWTLLRSDAEAHTLEPVWIRQRIQDDGPANASRAIARYTVLAIGPALLHADSGARAVALAATALALLGLGAGWFGWISLGLGACALAWILREAAVLLARIESEAAAPNARLASRTIFGWLIDVVLVALTGWGIGPMPAAQPMQWFFAPVMLFALLRIVPRALAGRWTVWLGDRTLLAIGLGLVVGAGVGDFAIKLAAVLLALAGILLPRGELRLTRP
jgi:hypothetical protein